MRYAYIDSSTMIVVNLIEVDPDIPYTPDEGYQIVPSDTANIGDTYVDGVFVPPPPPVLSPSEILAVNTAAQKNLMYPYPSALLSLIMAFDIGDRTDQAAIEVADWQQFYRDVMSTDITVLNPIWPNPPNT